MDGRYLLFAWPAYDQCAGWHDFRSRHATLEEAREAAAKVADGYDCWHIVDLETNEIVAEDE